VATPLRLLGHASYRGTPIASARVRALLATLADAGGSVSSQALVDAVWGDEPPVNAAKALQVLVSRTRSRLGPEVIESTPTGYRLGLAAADVDVLLARRRAKEARTALAAGRADVAVECAERGLALWDGPGLGTARADGDPHVGLLRNLEPVRDDLDRTRALAAARTGSHGAALGLLQAVSDRRPRDEEVLGALLTCEAHAIGHAAALGRYERYRRSLRDELGSEPGRALRQVHADLLAEDVHVRRGVRHDPNPLLGRADDLAQLRKLLSTSRVTSVIGPGGLGKTRVAHALSRTADESAVHVVELVGVSSLEDVVAEVASVVGARDTRRSARTYAAAPRDAVTAVVEEIGSTPTLLVLDNCEHVLEAAATLVDELVARTPRLRVLTTSRAPLDIDAERTYHLPQLDAMTSATLFTDRARAVRPDVVLDEDVLERLCARLDGLPLAIELAAARTRTLSLTEIEHRLADRFDLLRGSRRSTPARHQTLVAVIDWSWNLLEEAEQAALLQLGTFADGFTAETAMSVLGGVDTIPPGGAEDALDGLVSQSLLDVAEGSNGVRYRMLETVREYAQRELVRRGEEEDARRRLHAWARGHAREWGARVFSPDQVEALDRIRAEETNLDHVLREAVADAETATVVPVFAALATLWSVESNHARVITAGGPVDRVLYRAPETEEDREVLRLALATLAANNALLAPRRSVRAVSRLRRLGPAPPRSVGGALAAVILRLSRPMATSDPGVLEDLCSAEDPVLAALANGMASQLWENLGDISLAEEHARAALSITGETGDTWQLAAAHARLAELAMQREETDRADEHAALALAGLERLRAWPDVVQQRGIRLLAAIRRGDLSSAERILPGTEIAGLREHSFGISVTEHTMRAETELARGDLDAGLARYRTAIIQVDQAAASTVFSEVRGLEPWTIHAEATALAAHARHRRLEDVPDLPGTLTAKVLALVEGDSEVFIDYPVCGCAMFALGLVDLLEATASVGTPPAGGSPTDTSPTLTPPGTRGSRLVALAVAFGYSRTYPSLSLSPAEEAARRAGGTAYDAARGQYAAMERVALRHEAAQVLRDLVT
jgi:predicted ATPase/DNA-binding SARP family transcriptional activator